MSRIKRNGSIGLQLSVIMGFVILISLGSVNFLVNYFIRTSEGVTAESNNLTLNLRASASIENEINGICSNAFLLLDTLSGIAESGSKNLLLETQYYFFRRNKSIACIILADSNTSNLKIVNNYFYRDNLLDEAVNDRNLSKEIDLFMKESSQAISESFNGKTSALNVSKYIGIPSMAVLIPWGQNLNQSCIIIFSTEKITQTVLQGLHSINETYVVNQNGDYLIHSDTDLITASLNASENPLVKEMLSSAENNQQILYTDSDGKKYFGAYRKIESLNIGVLTAAKSDLVYETINRTTRNNVCLTFVILGLTVFIVLMYTHFGIARPMKILKNAVQGITKGQFNNDYIEHLNVKRTDEIGILNSGIRDERDFLNTFSKFTNQNVATAIATKSIDFEPHPKDITIFFSDIRGFTAISDGFKNRFGDDSAAHIIGFLNDYMSRMVECVTLSHGIIDKFEGDAIMAVWGILRGDDLAYEKIIDEKIRYEKETEHKKIICEDAVNCITGGLAMRYALMEYNKQAASYMVSVSESDGEKYYKPQIKIGCGINSGRASVGLMGSKDKMEYTSIGDAVNFASRTEASNKVCGTDILISEDTYNLIKKDFICCEENDFTLTEENKSREIVVEKIPVSFEVKGKGEQYFYGVVNMPNFNMEEFFRQSNKDFILDEDCARACGKTGPKTLAEVRTLLGINAPDYEKVNLNEKERKVHVKN